MKISARWRTGVMHSALLSLVSLIGLAGCYSAASEINGASPPPSTISEESAPSEPSQLPSTASQDSLNRQLLAQGQILPVTAEVELNDHLIGLEVAETPQQQAIGLMARESLPDDRGMLFPFEPPRPVSFWMKNVLIPLDMVFIRNDEIVAIAHDVPPCEATPCPTYGPDRQAVDYVLELRGGRAAELGLQNGDRIDINWLETSEVSEAS